MPILYFLLAIVAGAGLLSASAMTAEPASAQSSEDAVNELFRKMDALHRAGRDADAIPLAEKCVALARETYGEARLEYATALTWLGFLNKEQGRYAEAEPLYKRALAIREKALGPDHPNVGTSLNNLAALYERQGRYAEAEPLVQARAGHLREGAGPRPPRRRHRRSTTWPRSIASQGRYAEAEPLYQRALAIREKALGPDHPACRQPRSTTWPRCISARAATPRPSRSTSAPWPSARRRWAPTTPSSAQSLNNLAVLYQRQGRYAEAEPLYKRSLAIREKALGPDHPDVGTALNNLAGSIDAQGRYAEAEPLYKRALAIREKALGPDHPDVGTLAQQPGRAVLRAARLGDAPQTIWRRSTGVIVRRAAARHGRCRPKL